MRLTVTQLRQIIKEETQKVLEGAAPQQAFEQAIVILSDAHNALGGVVMTLRSSQEDAASVYASEDSDALQSQIDALESIRDVIATDMKTLTDRSAR